MSYRLIARFAPAESVARWNDDSWPTDRRMYRQVKPSPLGVDLIVNQYEDRRRGRVEQILKLDSDGPWWCAVAHLDGEPEPAIAETAVR